MAQVHRLDPVPSSMVLDEAARVVQGGGVMAIPTESFYALGAPPLNEAAVRRVCAIKGRPEGKPLLVLIHDQGHLPALVADLTPAAVVLMKRFWPGPLTLIFQASRAVPDMVTAGTGTIGIRQPAYPLLVPLLRHVGPLTGTSANRTGAPPARTAEEIEAFLGMELDLILDSGPTPGGLPSTVVDTVGPVRVLREGPITRPQIETVLSGLGLARVS